MSNAHKYFEDYGGRGIKVCERWQKFDNFFADMGARPSRLHEIDRINNDGDYEPGNCRWATRVEQGRNRRSNHVITHAGKTQTLTEWCEEYGKPFGTVWHRIRAGWSVDEALSIPIRTLKREAKEAA